VLLGDVNFAKLLVLARPEAFLRANNLRHCDRFGDDFNLVIAGLTVLQAQMLYLHSIEEESVRILRASCFRDSEAAQGFITEHCRHLEALVSHVVPRNDE
jgi:hypothetical protein